MEIADAPTAAAVYFGVLSDHPTRLVCTSETNTIARLLCIHLQQFQLPVKS